MIRAIDDQAKLGVASVTHRFIFVFALLASIVFKQSLGRLLKHYRYAA